MTDLITCTDRRAGRLTLNRPQALNALTWDMVTGIEDALDAWRDDDAVDLIIIDAAGDRAFCSGGDIAEMYASGKRGDLDYGRRFWRDEYRLNHKIATYPKPIITFLQGFTMGGGVGVGCHASHRIVDDSSRIAMPEVGIGLLPDVGGTMILARAPGRLGEYLGLTGDRMDAGDAIYVGFADHYVSDGWDALKDRLCATGDPTEIPQHPAPAARLAAWQPDIDAVFDNDSFGQIMRAMPINPPEAIAHAAKLMARNAPLSMAAAAAVIGQVRANPTIANALAHEYRFTHRAVEHADFIEGIRAAIIDKDRTPHWQHTHWRDVTDAQVAAIIAPLGADELQLEEPS